ncbi:MAG: XdhC family protein, partial [Nitrospinota bacterium]|nr:XdhC family protein [Nitrospinota bacterium]
MSEDIFKEMAVLKKKDLRGALATVVARKGSAPMSSDAKMLVREDGSTMGTVGGGCLEAEVWQSGMDIIESGEAEKLRFDLAQDEAGDSGHICGGVVDILVEPFEAYDPDLLEEINDIRTKGQSAALATVVQADPKGDPSMRARKMLVRRDGSARGAIPPFEAEIWRESSQIIRQGQPAILEFMDEEAHTGRRRRQPGEATEIFVEPITGRPLAYIFGGGHVSFCVAQAALLAGFRIAGVEDRPSFANA